MFPVAMTAQRDRLLAALGHIVSHIDDQAELVSYVEQLGRDHRRFGVTETHYPIVGRALLATLQRALGRRWTQRLAADWTTAYRLVADVMIGAAAKAATTSPPWWEAAVVDVQRRCAQITVVTVVPSHPHPYQAGQSVAVECPHRPRLWRYLSPANAPRIDHTIEFHVRAVVGGQVSPALTYRSQPGDTLRLGPPVASAFTSYKVTTRPLLLLAGGTGWAPMRAILEDLAYTRAARQVTLVAGARTATELYDQVSLEALAEMLPNLTVIAAVAKPPYGKAQPGSAVDIALRRQDWTGHDIYVCGSPAMTDGSRTALLKAGYPPERITIESFHHRPHASRSCSETKGPCR
jgi:NAD(P)H-flavin reductase